jgi:signal transduction histidine kinase
MNATPRKTDVRAPLGRYLERMGWARYLPRSAFDVVIAVVGLALCNIATWVQPNPFSTDVAGAEWLLVLYPLLLAVPLAWRRRFPLAAFTVIMSGVVLQAVVTGDSPEGFHLIYAAGIGIYSAAAYSDRGRAAVALGVGVLSYAVYAAENHDIETGKASELWAGSFFGIALVAVWLVGVFASYRREERQAALRAEELEHRARTAVVDERARLARELHDVISTTSA